MLSAGGRQGRETRPDRQAGQTRTARGKGDVVFAADAHIHARMHSSLSRISVTTGGRSH